MGDLKLVPADLGVLPPSSAPMNSGSLPSGDSPAFLRYVLSITRLRGASECSRLGDVISSFLSLLSTMVPSMAIVGVSGHRSGLRDRFRRALFVILGGDPKSAASTRMPFFKGRVTSEQSLPSIFSDPSVRTRSLPGTIDIYLHGYAACVAKIFNRSTGESVASSCIFLAPFALSELSVLEFVCLLTGFAAFSF